MGLNKKNMLRSLLSWEDPLITGIALGVLNVALLIVLVGVPILHYVLCYVPLLCLLAGLAGRLTGKATDLSVNKLASKDVVSKAAESLHEAAERGLNWLAPIVLWEDAKISLVAGIIWYFFSGFLALIGLEMVLLFTINGVFAYGKYHKEFHAVVDPHVTKVQTAVRKSFSSVPKAAE